MRLINVISRLLLLGIGIYDLGTNRDLIAGFLAQMSGASGRLLG